MSRLRTALALLTTLLLLCNHAAGQVLRDNVPEQEGIGVVDRIGDAVPKDATFIGADGKPVELGAFFDGERPVLLVPVYFDCPVLCPQILGRVLTAINEMDWVAGEDFRVVCYSFDHTEGYRTAHARQQATLAGYAKDWVDPQRTWAFLTSTNPEISRRVSTALGFHYRFVPRAGEYSHVAAVFFMTPDGEVHNFIEGLDFSGEDLQLALKNARDGEKRNIFASVYSWCFPYNEEAGSRTPAMWRLMTVGATGGAVVLFGVIGLLMYQTGRRAEAERARRASARDGGIGS